MDQCTNCQCKEDLEKCMTTECSYHELWMVKALEQKYQSEIKGLNMDIYKNLTDEEKGEILVSTLIEAKKCINNLSSLYIHRENTFFRKEGIIKKLMLLGKASRSINNFIKKENVDYENKR